MKIAEKIARRILRKKLSEYSDVLEKTDKIITEYENEIKLQKDRIKNLEDKVFGIRRILVSQIMMKCIVEMLPDPNQVGTNQISFDDLQIRNMGFVDKINGIEQSHYVRFTGVYTDVDLANAGISINITGYDIDIFIPLRRETARYNIWGISNQVDTYFWDFYVAGIRAISDEAWEQLCSFISAQENVLEDFRKYELL